MRSINDRFRCIFIFIPVFFKGRTSRRDQLLGTMLSIARRNNHKPVRNAIFRNNYSYNCHMVLLHHNRFLLLDILGVVPYHFPFYWQLR